jgi:hypothetical protein
MTLWSSRPRGAAARIVGFAKNARAAGVVVTERNTKRRDPAKRSSATLRSSQVGAAWVAKSMRS